MVSRDRQVKLGTSGTTFRSHLSKEDAKSSGKKFGVLRDKTRLRIIELLSRHGGEIYVGKIAEVLEESPSVISGHLAILRAVKMVKATRHGSYLYYTLVGEPLREYTDFLGKLPYLPSPPTEE